MRAIVKNYAMPMALLIERHGQSLHMWGDKEEYKQRFPCAANNGMLRNLFPVQLCRWAFEFNEIIERDWEKKNFTFLFPAVNPYPFCLVIHTTRMITMARSVENDLGLAEHKILADAAGNDDDDDEEQKKKKDAASAGSKGKYALAGAVAAAGTTAAISAAANA